MRYEQGVRGRIPEGRDTVLGNVRTEASRSVTQGAAARGADYEAGVRFIGKVLETLLETNYMRIVRDRGYIR